MEKVYKMLGYDLHLIPTNKFKNITISLKLQNTGMIPILGNIKTTKSINKFCNNLNEINNTLKYQNQ